MQSSAGESSTPAAPSLLRKRVARVLLLGVPIALAVRDSVATVIAVHDDDSTMAPALSPRDVAIVWKWNSTSDLRRGEAVVLKSPSDPHATVIRRLVGKPHDVVSHKDELVSPSVAACAIVAPFPSEPYLTHATIVSCSHRFPFRRAAVGWSRTLRCARAIPTLWRPLTTRTRSGRCVGTPFVVPRGCACCAV